MRFLKTHLWLLSFWYFLQLLKADVNNNNATWSKEYNHSVVDILKTENEIIKLRLENIGLNMEKQNYSLTEINRNLQTLQNNFEKLFELLVSDKNGPLKMNTMGLVDVQNMEKFHKTLQWNRNKAEPNSIGAEKVFLSDISEKDEPKVCKLNAAQNLICSNLSLAKMCSDSNSINCLNNKCRVKNCMYGPQSFWVACDGEWTVIQRRINGSVNFNRNWEDYKRGFGDLDGEFWIGLDKLHSLTTIMGPVELQIQLQDFDDVFRYANYGSFSIGNESTQYIVRIPRLISGDAGDSFFSHRDERFTTSDKDNDKNSTVNCASKLQGGWWHYHCDLNNDISNLNGFYYDSGVIPDDKPGSGILWKTFRGAKYSLKYVQMMIRAKNKN